MRPRRLVPTGDRGQLGVFMVLVLGAVALVVVSIVLLFGMQIAGGFDVQGDAFSVSNESFTQGSAAPFTYVVDRAPQSDDDVVTLDGSVTVVNETSDSTLADADYQWYPSNGTVEVDDGTLETGDTYTIDYSGDEHAYAGSADQTTQSTGDAFSLFGTSVLVVPASAVLAVLIGGLVGAMSMRSNLPGMGGSNGGQRRR
jgi:hypothetical protein